MTVDFTYKNLPEKKKKLAAQTDFEPFVLFTFFFTALGHPSVDQSSRHDPESIAVFCFAALLFTSFVLILVMLVK